MSGLALTRDGHIVTGSVVRDLKGAVVAKLPDAAPAHGAAVDAAGNIYLAQFDWDRAEGTSGSRLHTAIGRSAD